MRWRFVVFVAVLVVVSVSVAGQVGAIEEASGEHGRIVYASNDGVGVQFAVWSVDADGTDAVDLTSSLGVDAFRPVWSPDGSRIAFESASDVWVMDADGGNMVNVTDSPGLDEWYPSWSPDGSRIAYSSNESLWVMDADGANAVMLAVRHAHGGEGWSPDGSKIVYELRTGMSTSDLWVVDVEGKTRVNLTQNQESNNREPDWSPDGSRIVFTSDRTGRDGVWVMGADGADPVNLIESLGSGRLRSMYPVWSPDGSRIAFVSDDDVWVMDSDGANEVNLTNTPSLKERLPKWSSDGSKLVFDSSPGDWDIWVVDADGGGRVNVTNTPGSEEWGPEWQPVFAPIGLVDPATGQWHLRAWGDAATFYYGNPGDSPFMGDWTCDGVDTPGLYRQSDGYVYLRNTNTQGIADIKFFFGNPGDVPIAGDFNGDGCDTLSIYRPSEARFYIINRLGKNDGGLGAADYSFLFGNPGDNPVVGDWDDDGIDEIGLHRESTGLFYYRDTLTTGIADGEIFFGDPGDRFVAGDWGVVDGIDTPAMFRPSNTMFYFRHTLTQGNADFQFGWPGVGLDWIPVSGDFTID